MAPDNPRFGSGHMCAGCPLSRKLHIGCVVDSNVIVFELPTWKPKEQEAKPDQTDLPIDEKKPIQ